MSIQRRLSSLFSAARGKRRPSFKVLMFDNSFQVLKFLCLTRVVKF